MRTTHQVYSRKLETYIRFTYSDRNFLVGFELVDDVAVDVSTIAGVLENSLTLDLLKTYAKIHQMKLVEVQADLSFKRFWDMYDYKAAGDKKEAQKKWDLLPEEEKAAALAYIKTYNQHLVTSGAAKRYAATYLNKMIWTQ